MPINQGRNSGQATAVAGRHSNRISNLALACIPCNTAKGARPVDVFLAADPKRLAAIKARAKAPLKDAAAVAASPWALCNALKTAGLPVEAASGGRTKFNRFRLGYPEDVRLHTR